MMIFGFYRQAIKPPTGKYTRRNCFGPQEQNGDLEIKSENNIKSEENLMKKNKELQRLAFFGAGPKLPGE